MKRGRDEDDEVQQVMMREMTSGTEHQKTAKTLNAAIAFNRKIRGTPTPPKRREGG